ncbi:Metallo-dependent phosphatase [Piromyces finnis]|uniref:Metallo-dependent phosphatase n=1 Tax=Piromyces finnis TaxID=1754191 RepID=A0A1Y1VDF7_9FUNG|nr:Metallo-dependent phosphatase [Piromyces finnis]|eukprot:ORX52550.1 Metallo-dependent phosphatase [Piromyces finnis]
MLEYIIVLLIFSYFYIKRILKNKQEKKNCLSILIASDVHLSFENIKKLEKWTKKNNRKFDLILNPGDFCNLNEEQALAGDEGYLVVLEELKKISKNVLYIPGNHDSKYLFDSVPQDCENPEEWQPLPVQALTEYNSRLSDRNIHNKYVKIHEKNLYIAGFGGSIDAYLYSDKDKIEWPGFPFSEQQYGMGFSHLMNAWDKIKKNSNDALIILTHIGPAWIGTTAKHEKPYNENEKIQSGSEIAYNMMKTIKYQEKDTPLLWIHGHTHAGKGMTDFGTIPVVNPGGLCYGRFSVLNLKYSNDQWNIENVEFHSLK